MKHTLSLAVVAIIVLVCSLSAVADVIFFDTTFSDPSWLPTIILTAGGGGSASGSQTNFGGDDFLRLTVSNNGNHCGVAAFCHHGAFTYNPAIQGAITNLDYLVQLMAISSVTISPVAFASPFVRQNGSNYAATALSTTNMAWTPLASMGLVASDFSGLYASNGIINLNPNQHPDFSSSGGTLTFGYTCDLSTLMLGGPSSATFAINDVSIVVHQVRQPPSLGIQTVAALAITGIVSHTYLVEYTATLGPPSWQTLTNIVLPSSPFTVYDSQSASAGQRLYRASDVTP